ncbi:hypothetical protein BCR43DRAFT_525071 [Syncephalastrum racemosum]|uniref:Uncharacterized protein n=1 Tax=Syncephalastrum racemosum TaxID=13706 RepID=A0A1X2H9J8_SYNRA|nr:hypothetical protein BCR43DRAFT_525071 [Syncephalastrum racemosum]
MCEELHIFLQLLPEYLQLTAKVPNWLSAGHWQYLAWYVALSISTLSAAAVCIHACCCGRGHFVQGDRFLSILNVFPLATSIVTAMIADDTEPWTAGTVPFQRPLMDPIHSCEVLSTQPLLYRRCLLADSTLIGATAACVFWLLLACFTCAVPRKPVQPVVEPAQEPKWGRYIPEPPASLRSASIMSPGRSNNRNSILSQHRLRNEDSFDEGRYYNYTQQSYPRRPSSQYDFYNYPPSQQAYSYQTQPVYYNTPLPMLPQMEKIELFDGSTQTTPYQAEYNQHAASPPPAPSSPLHQAENPGPLPVIASQQTYHFSDKMYTTTERRTSLMSTASANHQAPHHGGGAL